MLADSFTGSEEPHRLFDRRRDKTETLGRMESAVTKSQVAFREKAFAYVWIPGKYLGRDAPLVPTLALRHRDLSSR
jgi:hypothetical protein